MRIGYPLSFFLLSSFCYALPLTEIDHFVQVYEAVKNIYVDDIDEKTLMTFAIEGLIQKLDPHSDYLSGAAVESFEHSTEGNYGGVGLELSPCQHGIEVMSVRSDTPASHSDLHSHDIIIMIDGTLTQDMTLREASEKIRGPVGSTTTLTVLPHGQSKPKEISLERAIIKNPSVQYHTKDSLGYIKINIFSQDTSTDFFKALNQLVEKDRVKGLLIDLRDNPGGLLKSGAVIANAMLDEDILKKDGIESPVIVSARGRNGILKIEEFVKGPDYTHGLPIVILINQGSASTSEIVTGALQDYGRAIVVGEQSFGKGSVQTVIPIDNNLLKVTCSRYFTPNGRSIQAKGITPDITIQGTWVAQENPSLVIGEKSLSNHLKNTSVAAVTGDSKISQQELPKAIQTDPILDEGLRILKALSIAPQTKKQTRG